MTNLIQKAEPVSILEIINYSAGLLKEKNIKDARLNVELMLCEVLGCTRTDLYLDFDKPLTIDETRIFREMFVRRLRQEPLQYILGKTSFYGMEFLVNRNVLIPRQETELLVEKVLTDIKNSNRKKISVFEIGTGSGCISIALAKNLEALDLEYRIFSIDKSKDAIEIASRNLKLNNLTEDRIKFYEKDVFEIEALRRSFDYISFQSSLYIT